ncbi:MAG TPA: HAMP domain-containing protein [Desulfonatronum sp.]|nr:HAMP domain-containing protein [Desulfonatronum sp.]
MAPSSLRMRILFWFWGLLLLVFIPLYIFLAHTVKNDLLAHGQDRAEHLLEAACWLFSSQADGTNHTFMQNWITEFGSRLETRLTYVSAGRVLADSHVHEQRLDHVEDHGNRPEILAALQGRTGFDIRRSATIDRGLIYAARLCPVDAFPQGIYRVALPLSELYGRLDTLKTRFLSILVACLLASAAASFLVTRNILTSLKNMVGLVSEVGKGAYDRRVHVEQGSEFAPLAEAVNAMAAAISSHVKAMREQKAQLEALFNGLSEGVLTVDQQGRILSVNPAFMRFFPMVQHMEGKTIIEATLEPDLAAAVQRILESRSQQEESLLLSRPGGRELEAKINIYRDPSENLRCVVVVQDVSLPRRMEKIRRDFVANVSHELRTPLTSIKGYTETLLGDPPPEPETARTFLNVIHKNAGHMASMVTDLLKLAKLESEAPLGPLQIVDAHISLEEALDICSPLADAKSVLLEKQLDQQKINVFGDKNQLTQVFQNIVENAIRFSPARGKITIAVRPQGEFVVFSITDQGPGIPREHQDRLFERFYRQDSARSEGNGGTGLGLAICKHIIRNHEGRIWVESVPGEGATFLFTLKIAPATR